MDPQISDKIAEIIPVAPLRNGQLIAYDQHLAPA